MAKMHGNGGEAGSMRGTFEERMRDVGEKAGSRYEDVKETMRGRMGEMKDTMGEMGGRVGGMVREHPVATILAGVGIGFLVGRLLSRD